MAVYATADGINEKFLTSTAKYLQGAVLAPTFYPDLNEPRVAAFVERYKTAYGEDPNVLDALAFDAVRAVRVALDHEGSSPTRQSLATQLAHLGETGLTGELAFGASGDRAGAAPLYVVEG
jgi:ABC-type branched-subunit amino acid transport system substrate-binding protein